MRRAFLFLSILSLLCMSYINTYFIFKLDKDIKDNYNVKSPSDFLAKHAFNNYYFKAKIGSNLEDIKIYLNVTDYKSVINENNYNFKMSSSYKNLSGKIEDLIISSDSLMFEKKLSNFTFGISNSREYPEHSYIGLGLKNRQTSGIRKLNSFIEQLVDSEYIRDSIWFIYNDGNNNDYLIIGEKPENIYKNVFNEEEEHIIKIDIVNSEVKRGYFANVIKFNKIKYNIKDETMEMSPIFNQGLLDFNTDLIFSNNIYKINIEKDFFDPLLESKECTREHVDEKYFVYYCNNTPDIKKKIKNNFPTLIFSNFDIGFELKFDSNDLFKEIGDKIYFLIIIDFESSVFWRFGSVFMNKYQFSFYPDSKDIKILGKLSNKKEHKPEIKHSMFFANIFQIIIIFILLVSIGLLGFYFGRKIYFRRKCKANELEEEFNYKNETL